MNSKNLSKLDKKYLMTIKNLPCGVCGAYGPSDAHHIKQGLHYTCIPLCRDCHQGSHNGIHGRMSIWNALKKNEMIVLDETIKKLFEQKLTELVGFAAQQQPS